MISHPSLSATAVSRSALTPRTAITNVSPIAAIGLSYVARRCTPTGLACHPPAVKYLPPRYETAPPQRHRARRCRAIFTKEHPR